MITFAYFGGEPLSVPVLDILATAGLVPNLIITSPDRPSGRGHTLTTPPTKDWAKQHSIAVLQPTTIHDEKFLQQLHSQSWDVFVVVAYHSLLPKTLIDLPKRGSINLHPSLLPQLRGPSPIRSALLNDVRETGVSIMQMDNEMDHGPIIAQQQVVIDEQNWPLRGREFDNVLAQHGGQLLAKTMPDWVAGTMTATEQDHANATYTKKFTKEDGFIDLNDDGRTNYLKFCAFDGWPGVYFFAERNGKRTRVKITDATLTPEGVFKVLRVIPEGKREVDYTIFSKAYA